MDTWSRSSTKRSEPSLRTTASSWGPRGTLTKLSDMTRESVSSPSAVKSGDQ
ncbi:MAG: hypothetical protein JW820_06675 [Spirochaetales bacterium]|nr:hypothetical protein [Spirochaetales bacterium]